jgi:hypothetical protein
MSTEAPAREEIPRLEFARQLGVTPQTLNRWCREGLNGVRLLPVRRGGRVRYTVAGYLAWQGEVDRRRRPPPRGPNARARAAAAARRDREVEAGLRRHGAWPEGGVGGGGAA